MKTQPAAAKELLFCWVSNGFSVLVPKKRGVGFLACPYGHHVDRALDAIGDAVSCEIVGLDGALDFQTSQGLRDYSDAAKRQSFEDNVIPALSKHYGVPARKITENEYWQQHPTKTDDPFASDHPWSKLTK